MLQPNQTAPLRIKALDENGESISLERYFGKFVVLYFYPKDNTPGCTKEACSFRDYNSEIEKLGAKVIGVSKDSVKSHHNFKTKHELNFELWSDPDHKLIEAFGAWQPKKMMGREYFGTVRSTFIINPKGKVIKTWDKVKTAEHGKEILDFLKTVI